MYLSTSNILQKDESINTALHLPPMLNFDFNQSKCIISPDNSFAIFYNDFIILNIDLKTKNLKWYQKFENNEKISDVQIYPNNQISFVKTLNTHNEIVVLSNNNYIDYNELKLKEKILAYKLIPSENSNDFNDMILIVNDFFQISLYKDNILEKSISRNIIKDIQNGSIQVNNKILNIEYLLEQKLLLFFFDNGIIVIYSLNKSNKANSDEIILEYENYINLNKDEDNPYTYYNLNIHKNNYICDNKIDMEIDNIIDNNSLNINNNITTFLIICANKRFNHKRKSTIYFYKIENGKFISIKELDDSDLNNNKIDFENREIIDSSIFKYKINNDENDMSDYIFVLFKQLNNIHNNKFIYSTEYSNLFNWFDLNKEINENDIKFELFEFFEEIPNSHIYINNINLSQKKPKIFTVSYCKLGERIISLEHNNKTLNLNNENINNDLLNSNNYDDYLIQLNSINFNEEEFNNAIINKYKELYDLNLGEELFKMRNDFDNNKDDNSKINYFLLNLIANQSLFKIKNYLLRRNVSGYIFPIEDICITCNFLLKCLKNKINNDNNRNNEIEKVFNIIINILKIVQNRNRAYNDKLFGGEKEIMMEQESIINSMIFDCEALLFIYKIQNLYFNLKNKNKNQINNELNDINGISFFNIFSLQKKNDDNINLEDNINDKIENNLYNLHSTYSDLFTEEKLHHLFNPKNENPITLNALLYYIKFIIFNNYFYLIYPKEINLNNIIDNNINANEYYKRILPEYKNYSEISKTLFNLDNNDENKDPNINLSHLITFLQYIANEKLIMNKGVNNILNLNRIIYEIIDTLKEKKFYNEALSIGNSLFSYLSKFDEYNSYLICVLELKDYPLAYSFLNNCLLLYYQNIQQDDRIKEFLKSESYFEIKKSYYIFYEYLIRNQAIDVLFKLPLNFIEIYIFKELCEENDMYKEFLIIYYIIVGNIKEAKYYFQKYINLNEDNDSQSKTLYANLIKYYETLTNKKFENEKVDELIENLSTKNQFLLKIDDNKEKSCIKDKEDLGYIRNELQFSESLMKSSIMENKVISGSNINVDDTNKLSTNLMTKISSNYNKNLSSNYLSKENKRKIIKMNEINPFSNSRLSSIHFKNTNTKFNNLISNE